MGLGWKSCWWQWEAQTLVERLLFLLSLLHLHLHLLLLLLLPFAPPAAPNSTQAIRDPKGGAQDARRAPPRPWMACVAHPCASVEP